MNLRHLLMGATVAAVTLGATAAFAATNTSTASVSANASIIIPISVANVSALSFGTIVRPSSSSSTVSMDPSTGALSVTGSDGTAIGTAAARGVFTVSGQANQAYTLSLSSTGLVGPGGTLTLNPTSDVAATPSISASGGPDTYHLGGNFSVSSTTTAGAYSGTVSVTATYN